VRVVRVVGVAGVAGVVGVVGVEEGSWSQWGSSCCACSRLGMAMRVESGQRDRWGQVVHDEPVEQVNQQTRAGLAPTAWVGSCEWMEAERAS
jgi:hypothetical protein